MNRDQHRIVEFRVDGKRVESVRDVQPPKIGETIEVGARFDGDERLDPGITNEVDWEYADYETVLTGEVVDVTHHYHTAMRCSEQTIRVDLKVEE